MHVTGLETGLQGQLILLRRRVGLQLEPVPAFAPLRGSLTQPHPLDVCILLVAHTAHHPVVVHGVHYVWLRFRAQASGEGLEEERILIMCVCY